MTVRRAPATLCPISSPLSPSLTFLFWILFLPPSFFSFCFVISMLYLLCQRNLTPLPLLFLSSRAVQPRPTDISISTFVALSSFTSLHFYAITFREVAPFYTFSAPSLPPLQIFSRVPSRLIVHVCRFIRQTDEKAASYYQNRNVAKSCACIFDTVTFHSHSENCFFGRLPSSPI